MCPCPSENGQKKSTVIWFAIPAVRYTEASVPLRGARYCGERDLGVKADYFTFVIASTVLELICFYIYLEGKDYVVFILYFWVQNVHHRI